ncbi:MAG: hypothetical protein R3E84_06075 [Pseudomonadales bacterium]
MRTYVFLAVAGALAASLGDFAMLYVGNAMRPDLQLPPPPEMLLWLGWLLGVLGLPLYGYGYAAAVAGDGSPAARLARISGAVAGFVGAAVHACTGWIIAGDRQTGGTAGAPLEGVAMGGGVLLTLWAVTGVAILVAVAALVASRLRTRRSTFMSTWLNPVTLLLVLVLVSLPSAALQAFLLPAAPNVAHLLFFLLVGWRDEPASRS